MNPKVKLDSCEVLEVESRDYVAKDGSPRTFRSALFTYQGKVFKMSVSKDGLSVLQSLKGKNANLEVELSTFGDNLSPNLTISSGKSSLK